MDYTHLLKEYNLKVTPQRLAIVEELHSHGHLNIDDLYNLLQKKFPSISLATIYKNIHAMIEKIFLSEVKLPNEKTVYELTKAQHAHIVCSNCKKIMDVEVDTSSLQKEAAGFSSFEVEEIAVVFTGICTDCK
jgi:Fur family peroxide stress response transcriptional regulator